MIIGKWNKSVLLTYAGVISSLAGMSFALTGNMKNGLCCLMVAGICDLFDGMVARRCKRTEEEKEFGVQLDSLADVMNFIAFPVVLYVAMGFTHPLMLVLYAAFSVCGIARLAHFNIVSEESGQLITHYQGLPVTYTALILPVVYLVNYFTHGVAETLLFPMTMGAITVLSIVRIKIAKPRGIAYVFFAVIAIAMLVIYQVML